MEGRAGNLEGVQCIRSTYVKPKCFSYFCPFFDVSRFVSIAAVSFVIVIIIIAIPAPTTPAPSVL